MFKGFIPGKRVASIDQGAVDGFAQGKENKPQLQVTTTTVHASMLPPTKVFANGKNEAFQTSYKNGMHRRTMTEQVGRLDSDSEAMNQAFDRLLVSSQQTSLLS